MNQIRWIVLGWICVLVTAHAASGDGRHYLFQLTKGKDIQVCEAYLERLNKTEFVKPPYCGRPETTSIPGFTPLNRIPLSAEAVHAVFPRVNQFVLNGKQGSKEQDAAYEALLKRNGVGPSIATIPELNEYIQRGEMKVWRYDPRVDIDNDGTPDNILVWQGYGLGGVLGACGRTVNFGGRSGDNQPQLAFVQADSQELDTQKTEAIFGHPSGGYRLSNGEVAKNFRPIGFSLGIFEYRSVYYFDTFFDSWGDFHGQRKADLKAQDTLGVFLRKDGKTQQVCEYQMTTK